MSINLQSLPWAFHTPIEDIFHFIEIEFRSKKALELLNNDNLNDPVPNQKFSNYDDVQEILINDIHHGFKPKGNDTDQYPLCIWMAATGSAPWKFDDKLYTNYMANKGCVAIQLQYDYMYYPFFDEFFLEKAKKLFDENDPNSEISKVCDQVFVDCSQGIVISGFSQGGQLALLAGNFIKSKWEIKGVLTLNTGYKVALPLGLYSEYDCLKYENLDIDKSKIRAVSSEGEPMFGNTVRDQMERITGIDYNQTLCNSTFNCIQPDGSGWCIVQKSEISEAYGAGHSWRGRNGLQPATLDNAFLTGTFCGSFNVTHDWLVSRLLGITKSSEAPVEKQHFKSLSVRQLTINLR